MTDKSNQPWKLLKDKSIYEILDGDTELPNDLDERVLKMPRKSGPELVSILNNFGIPVEYDSRSRWQYVEELLNYCIERNRISDMLSYFFGLDNFKKELKGLSAEAATEKHSRTVTAAIDAINGELLFGGHKLARIGGSYYITPLENSPTMETPSLKHIGREYIVDVAQRAQEDIEDSNYDSAITKARTLLEEVFCYVIELKGEKPSNNGDIQKLYNQVRTLYNMHTDSSTDHRVNDLVNGLNKIVASVAAMRNKQSDAHGVGAARIAISDHHARLAVNAAANVADFILSVAHKQSSKSIQAKG